MNDAKVIEILKKHTAWRRGEIGGARADLSCADLRDAHLRDADLTGADISYADLRGADLRGADLSCADLRAADLRDAHLRDADLRDADLRAADLSCADLRDAHLRDADLTGADLTGARLPVGWCRWSVFVQGSTLHIGCQSRSRADWDLLFSPESTEQLETPRDSEEWRRIRAAYLAAVAYCDALGEVLL